MSAKSTVTLKLKYVDEKTTPPVTELVVRRPKVKDHIAASNTSESDAVVECTLFATLCEVPVQTIENLDMADYQALQAVYQKMVVGKP